MKNCFLTKKMAIALSASMAILGILMSPITAKAEDYTWQVEDGTAYWYENGVKQGTYDDTKGVIGDGTIRGREIYDPESDGWYWLDACYDGAKACNKEVWIPYVYQNEDNWDDAEIKANAEASGNMAAQVETTIREGNGKWVRYDENGKMYKGWYKVDGDQADIYPDQEGNVYYYDKVTGLMAKGEVVIDGMEWEFDNQTGVLIGGEERMTTLTPQPDGSWFYTPNGVFDNSYTGLVYDETVGWWYVENGVINFKLDYAMTSADSTDTVLFTLPLEDGIIGIVVHKDYSIEETKATYSPINNIENASVGQLAMVKTVDTNGNVLSWTTIGLTVNGVVPDGNGNIDIPAAASDWNENDETQASYIHNRTHYEDENGVHPLDEKFIPDTVARVADIPNAIVSAEAAEVGQTIRVKNIDEDGKVEWEAVDFPETDLSAYYTKTEIDSLLNEYITEVDTIIG